MNYTIDALNFDGPLDLLLHLIKESEVSIFEINICDITSQYLDYINHMESINLNVSSEYLILAADLIELKSRELLPSSLDEEDDEEDPKQELINRLVLYQKYKEMVPSFRKMEEERGRMFSKEQTLLDEYKDNSVCLDITLDDLVSAFKRFKERKFLEKPLNTVVTKKEYSVFRRSKEILDKLKLKRVMNFEELFDVYQKDYVVVTFLSILELAKKGQLIIKQDNALEGIVIESRG